MSKQLDRVVVEAKLQVEVDEYNAVHERSQALQQEVIERLGRIKALQELLDLLAKEENEAEEPVD